MAFAFTITSQTYFGNKKVIKGTFANTAGSTGGDINTGLTNCESIVLQHTGAAVVASAPVANETFPVAGGAVTIVTVADTAGLFEAHGY
jgi:hypothetical protein